MNRFIRPRDRPRLFYLSATGSWFAAHGIQTVMFAWLVTIVLQKPPELVGWTQFALFLPATLLMLIGGSLADRWNARRVSVIAQSLAVIPPLLLTVTLITGTLNFVMMLVYAACIGTIQAFVTPARDAILNKVARGEIQQTVAKTTLVQFVSQMGGIVLAGSAQLIGGAPVLLSQTVVLGLGALSLGQLRIRVQNEEKHETKLLDDLWSGIANGWKAVFGDPVMRAVVLQNMAMGVCFMGSYIVTIPLVIRDVYGGSSVDIALVNFVNSSGLVLTVTVLITVLGKLRKPGRALINFVVAGGLVLGLCSLVNNFVIFTALLFGWGMAGGIVISMSRALVQERAPEAVRGRIMGIFSFSFMGSAPVGAVIWGYTNAAVGSRVALVIAGLSMLVIGLCVGRWSKLWQV